MALDSIHLSGHVTAPNTMSSGHLVSGVALVREGGRNSQLNGQCCDLAAIFEGCRVGDFEFERNVVKHEAIGQGSQHSALGRFEVAGQGGHNVVGADQLEQLTVGVIVLHGKLLVGPIDRQAEVAIGSFGRIQAPACGQPVLDVETAILQIPASSPTGLLTLESP